jgi:multidrug efflux pump subunit AcrB
MWSTQFNAAMWICLWGTLYAPNRAYTLVSDAQLTNAAAYGPMVVTYRNGAPVRGSKTSVRPSMALENDKVGSWFNDKKAVILGVQRQPGANVVQVVDSIKEVLPTLREQIPGSIKLECILRPYTVDSGIDT